MTALLRPRDGDALRAEIRWVARRADVPVVFGGAVDEDTLLLTEFVGTVTTGLRGLSVLRTSGLGGQAMQHRRPASVADYRCASTITHDYDAAVSGEGLRSVIAVPVVVADRPRAVLYAASRGASPLGDRTAEVVVAAGRRLAHEIAVRDEVDRRVRLLELAAPTTSTAPAVTEELREIHAELRALSGGAGDAGLRDRLAGVCARLTGVLTGEPAGAVPQLSRRELDVLAQIALGCTNQEAALRLSLGAETVKSYLRQAMSKLDARTRHEAVALARRHGLLP
ncbi:LuxR C-terminal-related transcriptional regulator [Nocardia halotolerans]|uniref:LuxR C-terminal-related transcriptional regulator n=1 Tax=Nocardia halotolerans TaxID=1755878 RepID=A0ABV8VFM1_9NOCA